MDLLCIPEWFQTHDAPDVAFQSTYDLRNRNTYTHKCAHMCTHVYLCVYKLVLINV